MDDSPLTRIHKLPGGRHPDVSGGEPSAIPMQEEVELKFGVRL